MPQAQFQFFNTKRFFPLFLTQFAGAFNDNLFKTGLAMLITFQLVQDTHHAQLLINLLAGIFILPFLLFSALAGQLADKFSRTRIIRIIKLCEILFMLIAALGFYYQSTWVLMLTVFLMGTHSSFFGPIKYSSLPYLLRPGELLTGNGIIEASTFIAILVGTLLGSTLGASHGEALVLAGISIVVAVIGWFSSLLIPPIPLARPHLQLTFNLVRDLKALWQEVTGMSGIPFTIGLISWFWFIGLIFVTQFPVYVKESIGGNKYVVSLFLLLFTVGIGIGSLFCARLLKGSITAKYVPLGILGMSIFMLDLCWVSHNFVPLPDASVAGFLGTLSGGRIALDLFIMAFFGGFYTVPLYTLLQAQSIPEFRSRVIACNNIVTALFMVVASIFAVGFLSLKFSTVELFLVVGIINAVVAVISWTKYRWK